MTDDSENVEVRLNIPRLVWQAVASMAEIDKTTMTNVVASKGSRASSLTTHDLHVLDNACGPIRKAFGCAPYLVGSAARDEPYRDVDVRLILDVDDFGFLCGNVVRWQLLSDAIGAYLRERTNLPIDFQIQRINEANERHGKNIRNPLGMGRIFAGGGDATPWAGQATAPDCEEDS